MKIIYCETIDKSIMDGYHFQNRVLATAKFEDLY